MLKLFYLTHTTASGNIIITGLPFQASSNNHAGYGTLAEVRGFTSPDGVWINGSLQAVSGEIEMKTLLWGSGKIPREMTIADFPTGGTLRFYGSLSYFT
jgi:hypothetical protein